MPCHACRHYVCSCSNMFQLQQYEWAQAGMKGGGGYRSSRSDRCSAASTVPVHIPQPTQQWPQQNGRSGANYLCILCCVVCAAKCLLLGVHDYNLSDVRSVRVHFSSSLQSKPNTSTLLRRQKHMSNLTACCSDIQLLLLLLLLLLLPLLLLLSSLLLSAAAAPPPPRCERIRSDAGEPVKKCYR